MTSIPVLTSKQVSKALLKAGFVFVRQKGSHRLYRKETHLVVVPAHSGDLKRGTTKNIILQSGFTIEEFIALL